MGKKKAAQSSPPPQSSPSPTWADTLTSVATHAAEKADVLVSSMSSAVGATQESITSAVSSPSTTAAGGGGGKELDDKVHSAYLYPLRVQETISAHSARVRAKASEFKDAAIESSKRSSARVGAALGQDVHEHTAAGLAVFLLLTLLVACLVKSKTSVARARAASGSNIAVTAADNATGTSAADVTSTAATAVSANIESEAEAETKMGFEVEVPGTARAREAADEEGVAPAPPKVASPSESFASSGGGNASCEEAQESTPAALELFAETEEARKSATSDIPLSAPAAPAAVDAAAAATDFATAFTTASEADDVKTVSTEVKSQAPEESASIELVAEPAAPQEQTASAVEEQAEEVMGVTTCDADSFGNVATGGIEWTVDVAATLPEATDGASMMGDLSSGASNAAQEAEQEEELPEPAAAVGVGAEASGEGVPNAFQHQLALQTIAQEQLPAPAPTVTLPDTEASGDGVAGTLEEAAQEDFQKEIVHEKLEEERETAEAEPARPSAEAETTVDQKVVEKAAAVSDVSDIAVSSTEGPPTTMTSGAASAMGSAAVTAIASVAVLDISTPIALATDGPDDKPITMASDCDSSKDKDASAEGGDAPVEAAPSISVPPTGPDHSRCEQGEVAAATGSRDDAAVKDVISGAADETIVAGAGAAMSVVPEEVADVVGSTSHVLVPLGVQDVAAAPSYGDALSSAVDAEGLFGSGPRVGENEGGAVAGANAEVSAGAAPAAAAEEKTEEQDVIASSMVEQEQETVGAATAVDEDKAAKQDDTVIPAAWDQAEAASLASRSEKPEGASGIAGASPGAEGSPSNLSVPNRDPAIVTVAPGAEMSELPRIEATMGAVPAQSAVLLEATPGTVATTAAEKEAETRIDPEPEPVVEAPMGGISTQLMAASKESDESVTTEKGSDKAAAPGTAATLATTVAATGAFFPLLADVEVRAEEDMTGQASAEVIPAIPSKPGVAVEEAAEPAVLVEDSEEVTVVTTSSAVTADVDVEAEQEAQPEPELGLEVEAPPGAVPTQPAVTVEQTNQAATLKEGSEKAATTESAAAAKAFFALVADVDVNAEEEPKSQSAFEGMTTQPAAAVEEAFGPIAPVENSGGSTPVTTAWAAEAQTRIKAEPETQPELEVEAPPGAIPAQPAVTIEKTNEPATLNEDSEEAATGTTATSAATAVTAKAFFALVGDAEVNAGKEPKGQRAFEASPTQPAVAVEEAFGRMAPLEDLEGVTPLTTASAAAAQAGMKAKVEPDLDPNINVPVEAISTQPATTASETAEPVSPVEDSGRASPGTMATSKGTAAEAKLLFALANDVEMNAEETGGQATIEGNRAQPASAIEEASEPTAPVEDSEGATSVTTGSATAAKAEMEAEVEPDSELNTNIPTEAIPTHSATTTREPAETVAPVEGSGIASPGTTAVSMTTAAAVKSFFELLGDGGINAEEEPEEQATAEANCMQPASAIEEASEPTAPVEDSEGATSVTTESAAAAKAEMETEVEPDSELNTNIPMEAILTHPATTASETDEPVAPVEGSGIASPGTTATSMATAAAAKSSFALVAGVGEEVPEPGGQTTVEVNCAQPAVAVEEASGPTPPVEDSEGATPVTTGSAAATKEERETDVEPDSELNTNISMEVITTHPATTAIATAEPVAFVEGSGMALPGTTATSMATAVAAKSFFALVAGEGGEVVPEPEGQATVEGNRTQPAVAVEEASEPTPPVEDSEGTTPVTTGSAAATEVEMKTEVEPDSELNLNVPMEAIPTQPATIASETAEAVALVEGFGIASPGTTATSMTTAAEAKSFFALVAGVEGDVVAESAPESEGEAPMEALPTQPAAAGETAKPVELVEDSGKAATSMATAAAAKSLFALVAGGEGEVMPEPEGQATVEGNRTQPAVAVEEASEPTAPVEDSEGTTPVTAGSVAAEQAEMKTEVEPDSELNPNVPMEAIPTQPATTASETAEPVALVAGSGIASPGTTATSMATAAAAMAGVEGDVVVEPAPETEGEAPMEALPTQPAAAGETAKSVALVEDSGKAATSMATAAAAKALFALVTDVEEEAVLEPAPDSEFEAPMEAIPTPPAVTVGEAAKPAALPEDSGGAAPETTKISTVTLAAAKVFSALVEDEGGEVSSDEKSEKTEDVEGDDAARRAAGDGHEAAASGAKGLESQDVFPSPFVAYAGTDPAKKQKLYDDMVLELGTTDSAVTVSEASPASKHHSLSASFFRRRRDRSGEGSDLEGGKEHPSRRKMLKKLNPFKSLRRKSSDKPT